MRDLVDKHGTRHWTIIARDFNQKFEDKQRNGKQCRDRWLNYVDPSIITSEFTYPEAILLCHNWLKLGNKWVEIAKLMSRTENWVKNHWRKLLKRENIDLGTSSAEKIKQAARNILVRLQQNSLACEQSCNIIPDELEDFKDESSEVGALTTEYQEMLEKNEYLEENKGEVRKTSDNSLARAMESEDIEKPIILNTECAEFDFAQGVDEIGEENNNNEAVLGKYIRTDHLKSNVNLPGQLFNWSKE